MGWFENQIGERRASDRQLLEDSFDKVAGAVLGERNAQRMRDERMITENAIDEVLKYYHCRAVKRPAADRGFTEQLDLSLRPHGIMYREVELTEGWFKDAFGPMLGFTRDEGHPAAMLPGKLRGYTYTEPATGERKKINSKTAELFGPKAICFYRPLPQRSLKIRDLLVYMKSCITAGDVVLASMASLALTLVGLVLPRMAKLLTGPVLMSGRQSAIVGTLISLTCVLIATQLITSVRGLLTDRINIRISTGAEASMMMRILSLPTDFFRQYSPGELRSRSASVGQLCTALTNMLMMTGLTSLTSLLYVTQIFSFAPSLTIPSVIIVLATVAVSVISTLVQLRISRRLLELNAKESGLSYALISGVQKLKLSGAETRGFAKWLDVYSEVAKLMYDPPVFIKINSVISTAITLIANIVMYYMAVKSGVSQSDYFAFTSAYGMLMSAFVAVSDIALTAAQIRPVLEMAEPFLNTVPEVTGDRELVTELSGRAELEHVYFRYDERSPYVLKDLSLKVRPGEYIAIVGRTGCGKSTLVRLLLGFEKPEKGAVYYDGKDINRLDLATLRRRIGVVMQDAGLFQGDIYSNIVITAPELTLEDAWEAAEKAGIADDIKAMPMGMHTIVSEGQGGISGGQRQRIMIARAIAPKPNLLIFDEATSALDNRTQRQVSEALDGMGCTRIVIAHRLSTIKHCDRILVLDEGTIAEEGSYDELVKKGGLFADLIRRQMADPQTGTEGEKR